jgi:hypothetical protein
VISRTAQPEISTVIAAGLPSSPPLFVISRDSNFTFTPPSHPSLFENDHIRFLPAEDTDSKIPSRGGIVNPTAFENEAGILASVHIPERDAALPPLRHAPTEVARTGGSWLLLAIAQHGAATFDAWTTNRAVARGYVEENPLLHPFAGSPAIYGVIQIAPALFDYVGWRMRRSESGFLRRTWWLPQTLSMSASLYAGSHNLIHTR